MSSDADHIFNAPSNLKSSVWKSFGFYKNDGKLDKTVAICKFCRASIKYSGSTTNLNTHLVRRHGGQYAGGDEPVGAKTASIASTCNEKQESGSDIQHFFQPKLSHNSARSKVITASIARFIAKDLRPYSVVENSGFRDMIHTLEPRYKIPSRQHFTDKCVPELYNKVKQEVEKELSDAERVAITTDAWTSLATNSYVTITVHHISPDWELRSHVLQTRVFNQSHTGKNLGALLKDACGDWKIADKEPALVTDNARNMIVAGVEAEMTPHLGCFAHTLNLASQKAFQVDTAARLLGRVRRVVGFLHRNIRGAEILREKQQQLALPSHKLIQDVSTRWNSSYDMLERFLEQQPAVLATLMSRELRKGEEVNTLNENDICNAEDIVKVMAPVKVVTTIMCDEEQPTISMIAPLKAKLQKQFETSEEDTALIAEMKRVFNNDFQNRYTQFHDLLHTASALDPRFKSLPFLSDHEAERIFISMSAEAAALTNKRTVDSASQGHPVQRSLMQTGAAERDPADGDANSSIVSPQIQDEPQGDDRPPKKKKRAALDQLFGEVFEVRAAARPSREKANEEVMRYRERNPLPLNDNPLQWWKAQADLPLLSSLAKKYLCIPATSVASERVFSTAGDIVSAQRSALRHDHVDQLIFLKKNLDKHKHP